MLKTFGPDYLSAELMQVYLTLLSILIDQQNFTPCISSSQLAYPDDLNLYR